MIITAEPGEITEKDVRKLRVKTLKLIKDSSYLTFSQ